jgi:hypothetical protein
MTTPIEGTTPRPWTSGPISASELTVRFGHAPECADGPDDLPWDCTCNYAERIELYQAAVNDYDRLRAIEDAARTLMAGSVVPVADGRAVVETDRLIALREAIR